MDPRRTPLARPKFIRKDRMMFNRMNDSALDRMTYTMFHRMGYRMFDFLKPTAFRAAAVAWFLLAASPAHAECRWLPGDGVPGVNGPVVAMTTFDPDGPGAQPELLIVAGLFSRAGDTPTNSIAAWDGSTWSALGTGVNSDVWALAVFDDGGGPALYAGGFFPLREGSKPIALPSGTARPGRPWGHG